MRSRSTTLSSWDVSTDYSLVSPPTDPVDPLAAAMEQVNLDNSPPSTADDDSFEIVVIPVSPASEQSESFLFSVLSIPSSVGSDRERGSGPDSGSDDSFSDSASGRSPGLGPAPSGRSAADDVRSKGSGHLHTSHDALASPSVDVASFPSPTLLQHLTRNSRASPTTANSAAMTLPGNVANTAADPMSGLTKDQRKRRRKAAAKPAAHQVLSGSLPKEMATVGFTQSQKKLFKCTIKEASGEVGRSLSKSQRQRRRKTAANATAREVLSGHRSKEAATVGFTKAQKKRVNRIVREAAGKVAASTGSNGLVETRPCTATADLKITRPLTTPVTPAMSSKKGSNAATNSLAGLSKGQRQSRRKAAVKAAIKAVLAGEQAPEEATKGFTDSQKRKFHQALVDAPRPVSPSNVSRVTALKISESHKKKLGRPCRRAFDADSDNGDTKDENTDDTESESGYSNDPASTMSSQDAANAIYADTESFTSQQENKLLLWQALCIEFGLVGAEDLVHLPTQRTFRSSAPSPPSPPSTYSDSVESTAHSRSVTPTQANPFPTSLNQAKNLLSTAHVNLSEYMALRKRNPNPKPGEYAHLLEPSASALRKLLRQSHQFAKLDDVKAEWLNPLLKDFGFARNRARSA